MEDLKKICSEALDLCEKLKAENRDLLKKVDELHASHKSQKLHKEKDKRPRISKALRNDVWIKYFGRSIAEAKCPAKCGSWIHISNFECGHIIAHSRGGKTSINNLIPICSACNRNMQSENYFDWVKNMGR